MHKEKKTEKIIKLLRILKKEKKRNKGKTDVEEREQKRLVFKNTREFKKETFF